MKKRFLLSAILTALGYLATAPAVAATSPLSSAEQVDLVFMREEEKMARDTYLTLYESWNLPVLSNISSSEQVHMDAILGLLQKYQLADPAASTAIGEFVDHKLQELYDLLIETGRKSKLEALKVGGIIEESDMRDIKASIERSQHADIDLVYENLLCGSRNHLRSFAGNIENLSGQSYVAQVLSQSEVDMIINTPMEKCGGVKKG